MLYVLSWLHRLYSAAAALRGCIPCSLALTQSQVEKARERGREVIILVCDRHKHELPLEKKKMRIRSILIVIQQ